MKTRYAKWRVSITLMTAQLVAGYLRGKPRSRSMHAATIKEHIKCTGYCRRDPYRQLLVSCCQPRRWTSRTYSYTGCSTSNRFSKLKTYSFQYSYLIQFPLLFVEFYIFELILTPEWILYRYNFHRSNRDFNFWGTTLKYLLLIFILQKC